MVACKFEAKHWFPVVKHAVAMRSNAVFTESMATGQPTGALTAGDSGWIDLVGPADIAVGVL